jgi:hypothetical protein
VLGQVGARGSGLISLGANACLQRTASTVLIGISIAVILAAVISRALDRRVL